MPAPSTHESFGHERFLHAYACGAVLFFGGMAWRCSSVPFVNGGMVLRIVLVSFCAVIALAVIYLYLRSGIQRYEITDTSLIIHRPWSRRVVPWQDIRYLNWNPYLRFVVLRNASNSIITFTSTELFPGILQFLHRIHERSQCSLGAELEAALDVTALPKEVSRDAKLLAPSKYKLGPNRDTDDQHWS